jgi:hypothetical protein
MIDTTSPNFIPLIACRAASHICAFSADVPALRGSFVSTALIPYVGDQLLPQTGYRSDSLLLWTFDVFLLLTWNRL